jgi:hypothetical protein
MQPGSAAGSRCRASGSRRCASRLKFGISPASISRCRTTGSMPSTPSTKMPGRSLAAELCDGESEQPGRASSASKNQTALGTRRPRAWPSCISAPGAEPDCASVAGSSGPVTVAAPPSAAKIIRPCIWRPGLWPNRRSTEVGMSAMCGRSIVIARLQKNTPGTMSGSTQGRRTSSWCCPRTPRRSPSRSRTPTELR